MVFVNDFCSGLAGRNERVADKNRNENVKHPRFWRVRPEYRALLLHGHSEGSVANHRGELIVRDGNFYSEIAA